MEERVAGFVYEISSVFENPETTFAREDSYNRINLAATNLEGLERLAEVMGYPKSETLISYLKEILEKLRDQKLECNREIVNTVLLGSYFLRETFYRELDGKVPPPVYDHILSEIKSLLCPVKKDQPAKEQHTEKFNAEIEDNWDDLDAAFTELDEMWQHQADMNHRFIKLMRERPKDPDVRSLVEMAGNLGNLLSEMQSKLVSASHSSIAEEMPGFDNLVEQLAARFKNEKALEEEFQLDENYGQVEYLDNLSYLPEEITDFDRSISQSEDISSYGQSGFISEKDKLLQKLSKLELSSPFVEGITILGNGKAYIILDNEAFFR